jgi:hypothetical protein
LKYQFSRHWQASASYSAARVNSRLTATTAGLQRTSDISFGPQTAVLAAGYSF